MDGITRNFSLAEMTNKQAAEAVKTCALRRRLVEHAQMDAGA